MKLSAAQKGFTLIELMVVIAIIATIAAIAYPSYMMYIQRMRLDNARGTMADTAQLMERYYAQHNTFCDATNQTSCTPPTINWVQRSSGASSQTNVVLTDNNNYTFSVISVSPSSYVLRGTPRAGLYSDSTLAGNQLILFFDSKVAAFTRCNSSGAAAYVAATNNPNAPDADGCEIM